MEADSTTSDFSKTRSTLPFITPPPPGTVHRNLQTYLDIINKEGHGSTEGKLVQSLQSCDLIAKSMPCPRGEPTCLMTCNPARVIDRMQWVCESCGTKQSVRHQSFFKRVSCSLLQALQVMLAWCEDAEFEAVAQQLGVKPHVVNLLYEKLDELSAEQQRATQVGGDGAVVLVEMYPDCLNRLSPDTTDQPHAHRILMLADTKHIPTQYCLHVIKEDTKNKTQTLEREVSEVVSRHVAPNSTVVVGNYVPLVKDAVSLQSLLQHCDPDMQHFLCSRIWRQALTLCAASRDLCSTDKQSYACCDAVQRYLNSALHRLRYDDGLYAHILEVVARKHSSS